MLLLSLLTIQNPLSETSMLHCDSIHSKKRGSQQEKSYRSSFVIVNDKGLHTRPSTELVKCTSKFSCEIQLICNEMTVNAKSILGILMLAASRGTQIIIEASGSDAQEAIEAVVKLAKNKFYMNY